MKKLCILLALFFCLAQPLSLAEEVASPDIAGVLAQALEAEAKSVSDPWASFLLSQSIENLNLEEDGVARFSLPAWDPGAQTLTGSEDGWLMAIWQNVNSGVVEASVAYEVAQDGTVRIAEGMKDFIASVKRAAASAKNSFDLTQVRRALTARLLPTALYDDTGAPTEAFSALARVYEGVFSRAQLAVALSAVKSASLGVDKGPENLRLVFYAGSSKALASEARKDALAALSSMDLANAMTEEQIADVYADAFAKRAAAFRESSSKGDKHMLILNFYQIMTDTLYLPDFVDYAKEMCQHFDQTLPDLVKQARAMPDYPLRDQPETGVLTSAALQEEGTLLILSAEDDGYGRYLVFRDVEGKPTLTAFVRSGEKLRAYIPQGTYTLLCARGVDWYGPRKLFLDAGEYVATAQPFDVLDDTHYHAISFSSDSEGAQVRAATADEFAESTFAMDAA